MLGLFFIAAGYRRPVFHSPWIHTMLRCVFALLLALAAALPAQAQRMFQANALRGELLVTTPPVALLNGKPVRLSPGARIRNALNMIQVSGTVIGQTLAVNYTLDGAGELRDVWMLTEAELANKPWPTTPEQAKTWIFDSTLQRWSKP
jgi:hypothetical protein